MENVTNRENLLGTEAKCQVCRNFKDAAFEYLAHKWRLEAKVQTLETKIKILNRELEHARKS